MKYAQNIFPAIILALILQGCASIKTENSASRDLEIADSYWEYAALAAEVYSTKGESRHQMVLPYSSPLLRKNPLTQVDRSGTPAAVQQVAQAPLASMEHDQFELTRKSCLLSDISADCEKLASSLETPSLAGELPDADERRKRIKEFKRLSEDQDFIDRIPQEFEQCNVTKEFKRPFVPVHQLTRDDKPGHWIPLHDLSKYAPARGWNIFVPDFAIDVWVRERLDRPTKSYEFAIVFRGTVGAGGWLSNLQIFAAWTPLMWDQYNQTRDALAGIINQIRTINNLMKVRDGHDTEFMITAVGHSLGAGLAQYAYYLRDEITKVVGFNTSPVDGSRLLIGSKRKEALIRAATKFDYQSNSSRQPYILPEHRIHLLGEDGEILGRFSGCGSGPTWGAEGGPIRVCDTIDLTTGNWFRQHDMRQMACKLAFIHANRGKKAKSATVETHAESIEFEPAAASTAKTVVAH